MTSFQQFPRKSHIELGQLYFWTATINKWQNLLQNDSYKEVVINSLEHLVQKRKLDVFAFVIMPNHVHFIWRIREPNGKESPHHSFLKFTAHVFKKMLSNEGPLKLDSYVSTANNKEFEFWKRDSLAIELFSEDFAYQKLDYIHDNPTSGRWQLVTDRCDYKYSTARYYEMGIQDYWFVKDLRREF